MIVSYTRYYTRNHKGHKVVSSVNNVICLYLSNNLDDFMVERITYELRYVNVEEYPEYIQILEQLLEEFKVIFPNIEDKRNTFY